MSMPLGHSDRVSEDRRAPYGDMEKNPVTNGGEYDTGSLSDDASSKEFQEGIQRVRAITSVWPKKTLWTMFALYVSPMPLSMIP